MLTSDIRTSYLEFFAKHGHRVVPSSPLIPHDDPSVLFTVAGMVQFKDALLGHETRDYARAVSCQRCVRAGGKHNDLENIGFTARHLTFFEMLGNFSFGDYFKEEAISLAWTYVEEVLAFNQDQIWITVHPTDDEARELWTKKIGIKPERVVDHPENFWTMGDTGPCGPCSEIFFDQGDHIEGGPPGSDTEDGDRYLEFWNLVFPQFDRSPNGELTPLAQPGVDTGMGLERVTALTQNVESNYQIDVFGDTFRKLRDLSGGVSIDEIHSHPSYRVIADHIRSSAFLIADGILPAREGRGYVLRRIIRRAVRHGYKLNLPQQFFHQLVDCCIEPLADHYPELVNSSAQIKRALQNEEGQFHETLQNGMRLLDNALSNLEDGQLPGETVFKLYDTYGFPVDLTEDICREHNVGIDLAGYEKHMAIQREQSRKGDKFQEKELVASLGGVASEFEGYETLSTNATVLSLYSTAAGNLSELETLSADQQGVIVLDRSSFYGEAGGQVGDIGKIRTGDSDFDVEDTQLNDRQILHYGVVRRGVIEKGQSVSVEVNERSRQDTARNHSATHLLHAALKKVLGNHVQQRGSLVAPDRLRFDFSHDASLSEDELSEIEELVNQKISLNTPVATSVMTFDEAMATGAVALFGEKYGDNVRVLAMGDGFSVELCGGTHVSQTGEIGIFRITSQEGIAAGVRRIEAVTGRQSDAWTKANQLLLAEVNNRLQTKNDSLLARVDSLVRENKELQKSVLSQNQQAAVDQAATLCERAETISDFRFVGGIVEGDPKAMMDVFDDVRSRIDRGLVLLAVVHKGKVNLVAGATKDLLDQASADQLLAHVAPLVGAKGGGRPDMSRAGGGTNLEGLDRVFDQAKAWITAATD